MKVMAMRKISLKSLLLGNLAFVLFFAAVAALVLVVTIVVLIASGKTDAGLSAVSVAIVLATPAAAALVGGYVAASFAKDNRLLHGALATTLMVLFALYADLVGLPSFEVEHPVTVPPALDYISTYSVPLFGMLGAYLRPLIEPRTILRWMGAVSALAGMYLLMLLVGLALFLWWKTVGTVYLAVVFAARFGIVVGVHAAPKHQREQATWALTGIAAIVPTIFILALAAGQYSSLWLLFVLVNAVGCFLGHRDLSRTGLPASGATAAE